MVEFVGSGFESHTDSFWTVLPSRTHGVPFLGTVSLERVGLVSSSLGTSRVRKRVESEGSKSLLTPPTKDRCRTGYVGVKTIKIDNPYAYPDKGIYSRGPQILL